jgi:hypothetical protein
MLLDSPVVNGCMGCGFPHFRHLKLTKLGCKFPEIDDNDVYKLLSFGFGWTGMLCMCHNVNHRTWNVMKKN